MTTMIDRYEYSRHSTRERAEDALEQYFAEGIVSEGERPTVERRVIKTASWSKAKIYYAVMFTESAA